MTDNTQELEQIIADHNKEMRADMASEITGGTRSKAITDVITVKAILGWHNKQIEAKLAHISEYAENVISIDENGEFSMKAIPLSLVAAERNKLEANQ